MRVSPFALTVLLCASALRADEGMWTFDNLPLKQMKERYGFAPDANWLEHLRLSVVRFPGATGSFVSRDGLVMTNHHVGRFSVQQVSDKDHDYIKTGFVAKSRAEEIKIPGLELNTLMAMENVTARVNGVVKAAMSDAEAMKARGREIERIKDELQKKTGFTCEAVSLYQGGEHWIYSYKKHTDVRLVMAPETALGAFGGDPDNFTYPRHGLDMAFFRVYENDRPYVPTHHLRFSRKALKAGDLTFVAGHPGGTDRQQTLAQMRFAGEVQLPTTLRRMERQKAMYLAYAQRSPEHARQVSDRIFGIENGHKALSGELRGLQDAEAMARIAAEEKALQAKVTADPALKASTGESWTRIEQAMALSRTFEKDSQFMGTCNSGLLRQALTLVRLADESAKPSDQRLPEFSDASLPAQKKRLLVPLPYYPELEVHQFTAGLTDALQELGPAHPFVKGMLAGKTPAEAAKAAVEGSRLQDPAERKRLLEGGPKAIRESNDPMILLAKGMDPLLRKLRREMETQVSAVIEEHSARIAKARFQVHGRSVYPDATFTLRLTYGPVAGYPANGTFQQPFTTFAGLYDRAWGHGPEASHGSWALPQRWLERRERLDLSVPLNFCHAVDIIGGNSGSAVVNTDGEVVGLIHDSNIEGLAGNYYYDASVNRGISVDARAILESLAKIYDAQHLVDELSSATTTGHSR